MHTEHVRGMHVQAYTKKQGNNKTQSNWTKKIENLYAGVGKVKVREVHVQVVKCRLVMGFQWVVSEGLGVRV